MGALAVPGIWGLDEANGTWAQEARGGQRLPPGRILKMVHHSAHVSRSCAMLQCIVVWGHERVPECASAQANSNPDLGTAIVVKSKH